MLLDDLREEVRAEIGEVANDLDDFDLICHVAYDKKPLTRSERAKKVKIAIILRSILKMLKRLFKRS